MPPEAASHRVEVRLLGPTTVRRQDGSLVAPREWRTSKTLDLLRLLALEHGTPVRTERLVDLLWPDVEESRGRASLRTAASQLRRVLHPECIERTVNGIVLRHAWVDVAAFRSLAAEARAARRSGQLAQTVAAGLEAEGLYLRDFEAADDESLWVIEARNSLASLRKTLLGDAAESAAELGWFRDALDLASRLVDLDPTHEAAHRVLIASQAGLGRDDEALRTYERIRVRLDAELGSRPSRLTRELHARVVSGSAHPRAARPRVGNDAAAARLAKLLAEPDAALVISLVGPAGSGRDRLIDDACEEAGRRTRRIRAGSAGGVRGNVRQLTGPGSREGAAPDVVAVVRLDEASLEERLRCLDEVLDGPKPPRTVVVVNDSDVGAPLGHHPYTAERVDVAPLSLAELEHLAERFLGFAPDFAMSTHLQAVSEGLAGRAARELDTLLRGGRVRWSPEGVTLIDATATGVPSHEVRTLLSTAVDSSDDRGLDVIQLLACLDGPMPVESLAAVLTDGDDDTDAVRAAVGRLTDLGLLRVIDRGIDFRVPSLRVAATAWTRPAVRTRLHERAAESDALPSLARVQHWIAAGRLVAACDFAASAAGRALAEGDTVVARQLCDRVGKLLDEDALPAPDTARLRRVVKELRAALTRNQTPTDGLSDPAWRPGAALADQPVVDPIDLFTQIEKADVSGSDAARVTARLDYVAAVLVPARELDLAHLLLRETDHLTTSLAEQASANTWQHLPDVLLGKAAAAQDAIAQLARVATDLPPDVAYDVTLLDCLVAHQVGRSDLSALLGQLGRHGSGRLGIDGATVAARILVTRERPAEAQAMLVQAPAPANPLDAQLRGLVQGVLEARLGRLDEAVATLRRTQETGRAEGCRLLLPEVTTRLIVLEAPTDWDAALRDFEIFDDIVGGRGVGAEDVYRLIARASIRAAAGQPERAVDPWTTAAELAACLHHPLLTAHCHLAAAKCLDQLGRTGEGQVHRSLSGRYFRQGGMPHMPTHPHGAMTRGSRAVRPPDDDKDRDSALA